jgi:hypothetical protein
MRYRKIVKKLAKNYCVIYNQVEENTGGKYGF